MPLFDHKITEALALKPLKPGRHSAPAQKAAENSGFQKHRFVGSIHQKKLREKREPAFFCWKPPLISLFNPRKLVFCSKKDLCSHQARKDFKESSTNLLFLFQTLFAGYIYIACYHNKRLVLIGLNSGQCELGASTAFDILMGEA